MFSTQYKNQIVAALCTLFMVMGFSGLGERVLSPNFLEKALAQAGGGGGGGGNLEREATPIKLLQPIDGNGTVEAKAGLDAAFEYANRAWPWFLGIIAGLAVLQTLWGGFQIILSGGDEGKRSEGIDKMKWAIAGFLMLIFAGFILRTINPLFYK